MTIEFLICTIGDGISRIPAMLMPPTEGTTYLVSWQQPREDSHGEIPSTLLERKDVKVITLDGRGLSRNRNHALEHATGDILVLADDDCRYTPKSLENIRRAYEDYPDADIIQFQCSLPDGTLMRRYPAYSYLYKDRPKGMSPFSVELTLRGNRNTLRFDTRFGIGGPLGCGEEEIFVETAYREGKNVRYVPLLLVETPGETTGTRFATDRGVRRAKGGVLCFLHGAFGAFLRCVKFAFLVPHTPFLRRLTYLNDMIYGIRYVLTHRPLL